MRTPTESGHIRDGGQREEVPRAGGGDARLARFVTWLLGIEAMLLVALGVSGLGGATPPTSSGAEGPPAVPDLFGLRASPAHSALLLVTGLLALGALWLPAWRHRFAATQALGYLLVTAAGLVLAVTTPAASTWHLNMADHLLHGLLCLLGLALLILVRAAHPVRRAAASPGTRASAGTRVRAAAASPTSEPPATMGTADPR
ncbi:MAG TPA: DUF4383 domain-containing protein [Pseudonocardia sp.]|nr:DUF4383 domain-containing protein [Pseudonocardia sp.]